MFLNDKVIWKEGLFLQPQHFQQAERFILSTVQSKFSAYNQFYSGFLDYQINTDSLVNETFSLTLARGIMPDGTTFSMPESCPVPYARNFSEYFPHDQSSLDVYLALPLVLSGNASVAEQSTTNTTARFKTSAHTVCDEVYGSTNKEIELGKTNFTILFSNESRDNFTTLAIARINRTSNGQFEIDKAFIPPLLRIGASTILSNKIKSLLEMLLAKSSNLSRNRKQLKGGFAEFSSGDITPQALLQLINTYTPTLNHYYLNSNTHPYDLYQLMLQFTGALCTFSAAHDIISLPQYTHSALSELFTQLDHKIRDILGGDISAGCIDLPINEISPATYTITISDQKLFDRAAFYLGVKADMPEKELAVGCISRIKMSSRNQLDTLIQSAMPGLPIMFCANPPKDLSTKPGYVYFTLNQQNSFWDAIRATGSIALYFPNNYPNLGIEFLAITS
ncbi:MAG: type VI secretion system baseplate subunit TssK [Bacteroidota bacterium]